MHRKDTCREISDTCHKRLLSLISNTRNNTHRNISWHIDPKDRPGTALPSKVSLKLQPACPEGLGGDRESLLWSHTRGRTRVKALEQAALSSAQPWQESHWHTELTQQGRHQAAPNQPRAEWECEKEGNKPLTKGFSPGSPGQGTVWLLRPPSVTQQPSELSPAPASAAPVLPLLLQRLPHAQHIPQGAGLAPLAAAPEAQEEEQLLFPFFFPQALTPPCPGLLGAVPKPCALQSTLPTARPDPKTAKAAGL